MPRSPPQKDDDAEVSYSAFSSCHDFSALISAQRQCGEQHHRSKHSNVSQCGQAITSGSGRREEEDLREVDLDKKHAAPIPHLRAWCFV